MANNRLYIGNKDTKEFEAISKAGDIWRRLTMKDLKRLNNLLQTDNIWCDETNLVLFTESDDYWFYYFHNNHT